MELTQEIVSRFVGGQLEAQNQAEGYLYRGEISKASMIGEGDDRKLSVEFAWSAKLSYDGWEVSSMIEYEAVMMIYTVDSIANGRIFLNGWVTGESTTLFLPGDSRLDPAKVKGLVTS